MRPPGFLHFFFLVFFFWIPLEESLTVFFVLPLECEKLQFFRQEVERILIIFLWKTFLYIRVSCLYVEGSLTWAGGDLPA